MSRRPGGRHRAMRVLHLVHGFPPRSTAGVEVYTARLAGAQAQGGDDARVLTAVHDLGARTGTVRRRSLGELPVFELVNGCDHPGFEATYADPDVTRGCAAVLDEVRPDVVHVQHLQNLSVEIVEQARSRGAVVVMTLHDHWLSCPRDGLRMRADGTLCEVVDHEVCARCLGDSPHVVPPAQRRLQVAARFVGAGGLLHVLHDAAPHSADRVLRLLRRLPRRGPLLEARDLDRRAAHLRAALDGLDAVVAPTRFVARTARRFGVHESKLRHIPHGVDLAPRLRSGPPRRFGYVGGLSAHKGVHVLIEAFRSVAGEDLRLQVHGDPAVHPDYSARLRSLARGDQRIAFCGPFAEGQQARVFAELDVAVVPSLWWENSPFALIEARASGARVVASRTGGLPELLPDGAGQLVPPGDPSELSRALEREAARSPTEVPRPRALAEELADLRALYASLRGRPSSLATETAAS